MRQKKNVCNLFSRKLLSDRVRFVATHVLSAAFRIRTNLLFSKMHSHDFGNAISMIACEKCSYGHMADGSWVGMKY